MIYLNREARKTLKQWNRKYGDKNFDVTSKNCKGATLKHLLKLGYIQQVFPYPDIYWCNDSWRVTVHLTSDGQHYLEHSFMNNIYLFFTDLVSKIIPIKHK